MAYNWIGVLCTLRKFFCFLLHCQASQTNVIKPNFAKWWTVNCANNLLLKSWGHPSRKKLGAKKLYICLVFQRLENLMANICWTKRDIDGQSRWKVRRVSYTVAKCHELWSTNGLEPDRSLYLPSLFRFVTVHRLSLIHISEPTRPY